MIFEQKKLNTETLSEYLCVVRKNAGLSLEEVSKKTGIKPVFLESLEEGKFLKLPADVYVKGFLKQMAALYNIEPDILVRQYKKERGIQQQLYKPDGRKDSWGKGLFNRIVITPKTASLAAGILFVMVTVGYIVWQVLSINQAPMLEIFQPKDRQVITDSVVNVSGKTNPDMSITVNGEDVFVDAAGNFKTQLGIAAGQKELVIEAKNKFDKAVSRTITVIGEDQQVQTSARVDLKLEFSDTVVVEARVDEGAAQTATFHNGDIKQFTGQKSITISVSDAGATKLMLNGQDLGLLGRSKESLNSISFYPDTDSVNQGQQGLN